MKETLDDRLTMTKMLMRLNLKKYTAIGVFLVLLWIIVSMFEDSKVRANDLIKPSFGDLEGKLDELKVRVVSELAESQSLLAKVKEQLHHKEVKQLQKKEKLEKYIPAPRKPVLPVLVISCNRVTVSRCLDNLIKFRPDKETFPIVVSQDCGHNQTYKVIKRYVDEDPSITVVRQPILSDIPLPKAKMKFHGYYKIARHFKFALNHVLNELRHEAVIIVEDDLDISPDFFEYFLGTYPLLLQDPSLWCISAWNDNGKKDLIELARPDLVHRTDFFPGLGWLLRADTWRQLEPVWPEAFFDDWLRNPKNVDGRACLRPEIPRTYSFGKVGVSHGLFFDVHLRYIKLNTEYVEFTKLDLGYLLKENYDARLDALLPTLPETSAEEVMSSGPGEPRAVRVPYRDARTYRRQAKKLGLMDDFRSGVPRTAYKGVVQCYTRGRRVYLAPSFPWTRYDPTWG